MDVGVEFNGNCRTPYGEPTPCVAGFTGAPTVHAGGTVDWLGSTSSPNSIPKHRTHVVSNSMIYQMGSDTGEEVKRNIVWTSEEDNKLRSMAIAGHGVKEIATALHRSVSAVYSRSLRFGLSLRQTKRRPNNFPGLPVRR